MSWIMLDFGGYKSDIVLVCKKLTVSNAWLTKMHSEMMHNPLPYKHTSLAWLQVSQDRMKGSVWPVF